MSSKLEHYCVILVLFLGLLLRTIQLDTSPAGLHNDEASFLVNALALTQTGKDEDGRHWPLYLNSYIDPKPAGYSYLQIPFLQAPLPQTAASRLPAVVFGVISLYLAYDLTKKVTSSKVLALILLVLLTVSPWHIVVSRATQEVILSFTALLAALWSIVAWTQAKNRQTAWWYLGVFILSTLLSIYMYHSAKIVAPLAVLVVVGWYFWQRTLSWRWGAVFVGIVISVVIILTLTASDSLKRFTAIGVFSDPLAQLLIDEQIRTGTNVVPGWQLRLFHNKVISYGQQIANTYLDHFSPSFLFVEGGEPSRYRVPFHGLLYWIELPLLIIGFIASVQHIKMRKVAYLMIGWASVAPVSAALTTQEVPSMIRSFFLILPLLYFVAVGIHSVTQLTPHWLRIFCIAIVAGGFVYGWGYFAHQFFVQQPRYHPWVRNVADERVSDAVARYREKYERVVVTRVTGQPYVYFALDGLIPLNELQSSYPARTQPNYSVGSFSFTTIECPLKPDPAILFVARASCEIPKGYKLLEIVRYADNAEVYALVSYEGITP